MTETRYTELAQSYINEDADLLEGLNAGTALLHNPSIKLAYRVAASGDIQLFANGEHCTVGAPLLTLVQLVCNESYLTPHSLEPWHDNAEAIELLEQLLAKGYLLLEGDDE